jgi:hypothetical protein
MKQKVLHNKRHGLADITTSHRNEVLFFANAHFLFLNFNADTHLAHFALSQRYKPPNGKTKRAKFPNAPKNGGNNFDYQKLLH